MITVYLDMDGVLADFWSGVPDEQKGHRDPPAMYEKGFFRNLKVMPGAEAAIKALRKYPDIDLYVATKPSVKNLWSTIEKYEWIQEHFPFLVNRMFLACDKEKLIGDFLVDDEPLKWGGFTGRTIAFVENDPEGSWKRAVKSIIEGQAG